MWLLNIFPEFITHLIFLLGIFGTIAGLIISILPAAAKYKLPVLLIGILLLTIGVYLEGGLSNEEKWKKKITEMERTIADLKVKSDKVNVEIVTEVVTKNKVIKEKGESVIKYIDREVVKYDSSCTIPAAVITAHNAAATNTSLDVVLTPTTLIDSASHNAATVPPMRLPKK